MIALVVCHHAAVTYSHVGSSYYSDGPKPGLATTVALATFEAFNQAYFMGLLFLLAGYFVPGALDAKGTVRFLRDRAMRLGVPALFFMLVIHPFIVYGLLRFAEPWRPSFGAAYVPFLTSGRVLSASGPMWFAIALLVFCVVYAAAPFNQRVDWMPGHAAVAGLMLAMAVGSFLVRIVQPIGTSVFNMQLGYFTPYVLLFAVGVLAYRGDWLRRLDAKFARVWLRLAGTVGVAMWFVLLATSGALKDGTEKLLGGAHWQSAAMCLWEAFFCVGMCLGLILIFRERFNTQSRFAEWMSRNSFSAYLFHMPVLIAVILLLRGVAAGPLVKFAVACLVATPLAFAVGGAVRKALGGRFI